MVASSIKEKKILNKMTIDYEKGKIFIPEMNVKMSFERFKDFFLENSREDYIYYRGLNIVKSIFDDIKNDAVASEKCIFNPENENFSQNEIYSIQNMINENVIPYIQNNEKFDELYIVLTNYTDEMIPTIYLKRKVSKIF